MQGWKSIGRPRCTGTIAAPAGGLLLALLLGCESPAPGEEGPGEGLHAEIHTSRGEILVSLEPERAPLATASFVGLAEGTIRNDAFEPGRPFYDGSPFHRVVPGHVIQGGAPDTPEASGPGYSFPNEIHADLSHDRAGILGVANSGPHTNSSQFYITLGDRSYLDGIYIVFGEVLEGMDLVSSIREGDRIDSVRVVRIGARAAEFRPDTESFELMVGIAEAEVVEQEQARRRGVEAWIDRNLPELEGDPAGVRVAQEVGEQEGGRADDEVQDAARLEARYTGTALRYRGHLVGFRGEPIDELQFGSADDGSPGFHDPPAWFPLGDDEPRVPDGLRGLLLEMSPGDRTVAVVPAPLAYGGAGHFAPERPGEPRFVIPPETTIVYEVELRRR